MTSPSEKRVVQLNTNDGPIAWQPFSDRITEMLKRFPPPDYGFVSDIKSWGERNDLILVTAALIYYPREGKPQRIAERNAFGVLHKIKDLEKIETAASQRLYAALDCGGQCFDADEQSWAGDESNLPWAGSAPSAPEGGNKFKQPPSFRD